MACDLGQASVSSLDLKKKNGDDNNNTQHRRQNEMVHKFLEYAGIATLREMLARATIIISEVDTTINVH